MKRKPLIAVVDDDPAIQRALERFLRLRGCESRLYSSASDFVASYALAVPDCLILDVQMLGMNGLELQRLCVKTGCNFPIIFITAYEDAAAEAQAVRSGAVGYFHKPFRNEALWAVLANAIGSTTA